jgi:hypothetical protein
MTEFLTTPAARGDWAALLDRIDASIARALKTTTKQEKLFAGKVEANDPPPDTAADHLDGLRSRLDAAGTAAEGVGALLAADEHEAREWVGLAGRLRERLASPPVGRVS